MYRLKKNVADFVVTDGPLAGRNYRAGGIYTEVPPGEKHKFEAAVNPPLPPASSFPRGGRGIFEEDKGGSQMKPVKTDVPTSLEGGKKR